MSARWVVAPGEEGVRYDSEEEGSADEEAGFVRGAGAGVSIVRDRGANVSTTDGS